MKPIVRTSRPPRGSNVANSLRARANILCIPQSVAVAAPSCAITCIESFIASNYNPVSCMEASNLTFLCATKTTSGLTIGEGGLHCVVSDCATTNYTKIYNICDNILSAQPRLASTITATVYPTVTSKLSSSFTTAKSAFTDLSPSSSSSSSLSSQLQSLGLQTQSVDITQIATQTNNAIPSDTGLPLATTRIAFTTANSPFPATSPYVHTNTPITSSATAGETVGIAIGTVFGAFGLIGVIFFMCIKRKKRREKKQRQDQLITTASISPSSSAFNARRLSRVPTQTPALVSGSAQMTEISLEPSLPTPLRGVVPASIAGDRRLSLTPWACAVVAPITEQRGSQLSSRDHKKSSFWRRSIGPEEIGVAVSPKGAIGFFGRIDPRSRRKMRSTISVLESTVLSKISSPAGSEDDLMAGLGARETITVDGRVRRNVSGHTSADILHSKVKGEFCPFRSDKSEYVSDVEAQTDGHTSSTRGSLLGSTGASAVNVGALLARIVSMKREHAAPRPLILDTLKSNKEAIQTADKYPLTPKYDNGTYVASSFAVHYKPPSHNQLDPPPQLETSRQTMPSGSLHGTLLPTSVLMSPPSFRSGNSDGQPRPPFPHPSNNDQNNATNMEDTWRSTKTQRNRTGKPLERLPAPLSMKMASTGRSRRSGIVSPMRSLRDTQVLSAANMNSFAVKGRASRSPSSKSRLMKKLPEDYTNKPLPLLASISNFDPVRAAATSPKPVGPASNSTTGLFSHIDIDVSPRRKPGFSTMAPSLTSIYTGYKSPKLTPPPPLALGGLSNTYTDNRDTGDMFTLDSAISRRNSETPKWVLTPNRTKTGDLVLTVGDV